MSMHLHSPHLLLRLLWILVSLGCACIFDAGGTTSANGQVEATCKLDRWQQMAPGQAAPRTGSFLPCSSSLPTSLCSSHLCRLFLPRRGKKSDAISLHVSLKRVTPASSKKHPTDGCAPWCSEEQQHTQAVSRFLWFQVAWKAPSFLAGSILEARVQV